MCSSCCTYFTGSALPLWLQLRYSCAKRDTLPNIIIGKLQARTFTEHNITWLSGNQLKALQDRIKKVDGQGLRSAEVASIFGLAINLTKNHERKRVLGQIVESILPPQQEEVLASPQQDKKEPLIPQKYNTTKELAALIAKLTAENAQEPPAEAIPVQSQQISAPEQKEEPEQNIAAEPLSPAQQLFLERLDLYLRLKPMVANVLGKAQPGIMKACDVRQTYSSVDLGAIAIEEAMTLAHKLNEQYANTALASELAAINNLVTFKEEDFKSPDFVAIAEGKLNQLRQLEKRLAMMHRRSSSVAKVAQ
jgi:hypothetical protein